MFTSHVQHSNVVASSGRVVERAAVSRTKYATVDWDLPSGSSLLDKSLVAWIVTIRRRTTGDVVWCWHRTHLNTTDYWLGLYKDTATPLGTTTWMDGSPSTYRNWAKTYPKHQAKCVVYTKDGFKDKQCNTSFYYTCKRDSTSNRLVLPCSCDII